MADDPLPVHNSLVTKRRWFIGIGAIIAAPLMLLLLIQLTAPLWLDTAAVKAQVARLVSKATGGRASYTRLELRFFPWPRAVLDTLEFALPGTVQLSARAAEIDIRLLPLFHGSVEPRRLRVLSPRITLTIAKSAPDTQKAATPFSLKGTDAQLRTALAAIESRMPGLEADVDDGHVELDLPSQPPLILEKVNVVISVDPGSVMALAGVTTPWAKRVTARALLSPADLSGDVAVHVTELDAAALGPAFALGAGWPVTNAVVSASVTADLHGLSDAQAQVSISAPKVALRFGKARVDAAALALDAAAQTAHGAVTLTLKQFALDAPRLGASGTIVRDSAGAFTMAAQLANVDLPTAQTVIQGLAPEIPALQGLPVTVTRGTLADAKLESRAVRIGDLFALPTMAITGEIRNIDATLTVFQDLPITNASASVSLTGGKLHAASLVASVGPTTARDGTFDIDLNPAVPPMRGTITVEADLAQGFAIAGRVLGKDSAATLGPITGVRGTVLARATIGGNTNRIVPRVDFSELRAAAHYAAIPFPIRIIDGGGSYSPAALSVRALRGTIGHSTFDSLDAGVALTGPMVVTATRGSVHLALPELFHWASQQPKLAKQLDSVRSVTGALTVSVAALSLPVKTPAQLTFRASAFPSHIVVDAPHFGPRATVDGGVVHVTEQRVNASDVSASALDAHLVVAGGTEDYRDSTSELLVFAKGTVGLDALAWVYAKAELPDALKLRGALTIKDASVSLRTSAGLGASGTVAVAGGPEIGFDLHSRTDQLQVERFTLHDDASNLSAGVSIDGPKIKALWKGRLAGSTMDRIFLNSPLELDYLDGDIHVEGDLKHPESSHATGTLAGSGIHLERAIKAPLVIDRLALEAKDSVFYLRTADLSSGASRGSVTGSDRVPRPEVRRGRRGARRHDHHPRAHPPHGQRRAAGRGAGEGGARRDQRREGDQVHQGTVRHPRARQRARGHRPPEGRAHRILAAAGERIDHRSAHRPCADARRALRDRGVGRPQRRARHDRCHGRAHREERAARARDRLPERTARGHHRQRDGERQVQLARRGRHDDRQSARHLHAHGEGRPDQQVRRVRQCAEGRERDAGARGPERRLQAGRHGLQDTHRRHGIHRPARGAEVDDARRVRTGRGGARQRRLRPWDARHRRARRAREDRELARSATRRSCATSSVDRSLPSPCMWAARSATRLSSPSAPKP